MSKKLITVGWIELASLPELSIPAIRVKVDTGARTSALHVTNLERFERQGEGFASFDVHPMRRYQAHTVRCQAPVIGEKKVKSSGGHVQIRPVVVTSLCIAGQTWTIQVTLTNREKMRFKMLLGREAMREKIEVDPGAQYLQGYQSHKSMMSTYNLR